MHANNRGLAAPKAVFRTAGGSIYTFAHPYLTGQISLADPGGARPTTDNRVVGSINEVDISSSLKLNQQFFNATQAQPNALQEVMVDGSTVTITNHMMNGRAALTVVPGTGLVKDGDLTAIAIFIAASKDSVGGVLTRKRFTSAGAITRIYYGVSFADFPHDIDVGNAVPEYQITMLYGGFIEGLRISGQGVDRVLWAVGNKFGLNGNFTPFAINGIGDVASGGVFAQRNANIDSDGSADTDLTTGQTFTSGGLSGIGTGVTVGTATIGTTAGGLTPPAPPPSPAP